jgi:hypothetical protein
VKRVAEQPIEQRADLSALVGNSNLTEDLALTGDERVEPGGDTEQVDGRSLVLEAVEERLEVGRIDLRELGQRPGRAPVGLDRIGRCQVDLRSIAGGEADCAAAPSGSTATRSRTSTGASRCEVPISRSFMRRE